MSATCFDLVIENNIAHLVLNRPKAFNSMVREFWNELPALVRDIDDNARARVIVISSTGRHFSAGMDLSVFTGGSGAASGGGRGEVGRQRANFRRNVLRLQRSFSCLEQARMPVLAAVQG